MKIHHQKNKDKMKLIVSQTSEKIKFKASRKWKKITMDKLE